MLLSRGEFFTLCARRVNIVFAHSVELGALQTRLEHRCTIFFLVLKENGTQRCGLIHLVFDQAELHLCLLANINVLLGLALHVEVNIVEYFLCAQIQLLVERCLEY